MENGICGKYKAVTNGDEIPEEEFLFKVLKNISGQKFGRLTAKYPNSRTGSKTKWLCECECGNTKSIVITDLLNGKTKSCGCLRNERIKEVCSKHNKSNSKEYRIWAGMNQRCKNPNNSAYEYYGGRGIKVCKEWDSQTTEGFSNFYKDMGKCPSIGFSLERKNRDKGYYKDNCIWATATVQCLNRKFITKIQGVSYNKTKKVFETYIDEDKKRRYLGAYKNFFDACCARKSAEKDSKYKEIYFKRRYYE